MSINSKQSDFQFDDLRIVGERVGINRPVEIIEKTVSVVSSWNEYAKDCGVKKAHAQQIFDNLLLVDKSKSKDFDLSLRAE